MSIAVSVVAPLKLMCCQKARLEARRQQLGETGLKELAEKLEVAKTENDKPIPMEVIDQFAIPSVGSIHFIPTIVCISGPIDRYSPNDLI